MFSATLRLHTRSLDAFHDLFSSMFTSNVISTFYGSEFGRVQYEETVIDTTEAIIVIENSNRWLQTIFLSNFDIDIDMRMSWTLSIIKWNIFSKEANTLQLSIHLQIFQLLVTE